MANNIDTWLPDTGQPNLKMLIIVVFIINFLSATQDIVVDGWALTMLKKYVEKIAFINNSYNANTLYVEKICFLSALLNLKCI